MTDRKLTLGVIGYSVPAGAQCLNDCEKCRDDVDEVGWMHIFGGEGAHFDGCHGGEGPDTCGGWHSTCIPDEEELEEMLALLQEFRDGAIEDLGSFLEKPAVRFNQEISALQLVSCDGYVIAHLSLDQEELARVLANTIPVITVDNT